MSAHHQCWQLSREIAGKVQFSVSIITGKETKELLKVVNGERKTVPKDAGAHMFTFHLPTEQAF